LQRTMIVVEGVARSLDPQVNIWTAAKPVVEAWMRDNLGPKAVARDLRDAVVVLARYAPRLPGLAEGLIRAADARSVAEAADQSGRDKGAARRAGLWGALLGAAATGAAVYAGQVWG